MAYQAIAYEGTFYLNRLLRTGVYAGMKPVIGIAALELMSKAKSELLKSNDKGSYGLTAHSMSVIDDTSASLEIQEFDRESLAMSLIGDSAELNSGAGTVADEPITAKLGAMVALAHINIEDGSVIVTNTGGTITYDIGDDYTVNYVTGHITALAAGDITEAQGLEVTYDFLALSGSVIYAGAEPLIKGAAMFEGINLADGTNIIIDFPSVQLISDGSLSVLTASSSPKFSTVKFKMDMFLTDLVGDNGRKALYKVRTF